MIKRFLSTTIKQATHQRAFSSRYIEYPDGKPANANSSGSQGAASDEPMVRGVSHVFNDSQSEVPDVYALY